MRRVMVLGFVAAALFTSDAFAWGKEGHMTVCRMAFFLLDEAHQDEVMRLTRVYKKPDGTGETSFAEACTFPDEARANAVKKEAGWEIFSPFNSWHFINVPRERIEITESDCGGNCVLTGIAHHSAALRDAKTDQERAEALLFLGHWLGDIHQPLHVSYADDQGGNKVQPIGGGFYNSPTDKYPTNLHSVWDTKIIDKARGDSTWQTWADRVAKQITPVTQVLWVETKPVEWAQESYAITTMPDVDYCEWHGGSCAASADTSRTLTAAYQAEFQEQVQTRLKQAAVRLADAISKNLRVE